MGKSDLTNVVVASRTCKLAWHTGCNNAVCEMLGCVLESTDGVTSGVGNARHIAAQRDHMDGGKEMINDLKIIVGSWVIVVATLILGGKIMEYALK